MILRTCVYEGCRAPFRVDADAATGYLYTHMCVLCREIMRAEMFARAILKEPPAEKEPERWV